MALAPVALFSDPMENYPANWIKFYLQGTTTPLAMAIDSTGSPTVAKAEISSGGVVPIGFLKTAGDAIFIPYVSEAYDLWLFPTEAEADANDTSSAIQLADNVSFLVNFANQVGVTKSYNTLALMLADTSIVAGNSAKTLGYITAGGGGDNSYLARATTGGPYDPGSLIASTGNPAIEFVGLFPGGEVKAAQFGMVEGDVDNSVAFVAAVAYSASVDFGSKKFKIKSQASVTLTRDTFLTADGGGLLVEVPDGFQGDAVGIDCAGFSFETENIYVSGESVTAYPMYIFDNQDSSSSVTIHGVFNNSYTTANFGNFGLCISGGFENVKILDGCEFKNHSRALGAGNPAVAATRGVSIQELNTFNPKNVIIGSIVVEEITNGETADTANNTDVDGLRVSTTTTLPAGEVWRKTRVTVNPSVFKNCKGRAIKIQADIVDVIAPSIYRNISAIGGSGTSEIGIQGQGGSVVSPSFTYEDSTSGEATFIRNIAPINLFSNNSLVTAKIINISDVSIYDNTTAGSSMGPVIIEGSHSDITSAFDTIINISGVNSSAITDAFMNGAANTGSGRFIVQAKNVYCKELTHGVFSLNNSVALQDTVRVSFDGFVHGGADVPPSFLKSAPATPLRITQSMSSYVGVVSSLANGSGTPDNKVRGIQEDGLPGTNQSGMHVFSRNLLDDDSFSITAPLFNNRGFAIITTSEDKESVGMVTLDGSGAVDFNTVGTKFNAGGLANPDIDGDLNVWYTGGVLSIKNRLANTRLITVTFLG